LENNYAIFPTVDMSVDAFNELYQSLPWSYGEKNEKRKSNIMVNIFENNIRCILNKIFQNSYEHINNIDEFPQDKGREILAVLLDYACKGQTHAYIYIARRLILQIPNKWIMENFIPVANHSIECNDDWEYRRLLELTELISKELLLWGISIGYNSNYIGVKEASEDFEKRLAELDLIN